MIKPVYILEVVTKRDRGHGREQNAETGNCIDVMKKWVITK